MAVKYAVITEIVRETEKAILVEGNGQTWLPKSQIEIIETDIAIVVKMPVWLWMDKRTQLSITTSPENIYETTGVICE